MIRRNVWRKEKGYYMNSEQFDGFDNARNERVERELPKYQSHKQLWALKIKSIILDSELAKSSDRETDGSATITPEEEGYTPFKVDAEYVRKHKPFVGGYYVVYQDGYKSFSPAKAFEEGNTRC